MSNTTGKQGSLQSLLYIAVLCGVIGLVPALAAGVKHAGGAVLGLVGFERSAPHPASSVGAHERPVVSGTIGMRPMSGCILSAERERLCRV